MHIKYLGHSTFLLKSDQGPSILTDPYKSGAYGGALTYAPISDIADMVTLSHEHEDHAEYMSLPNQPLVVRTDSRAMGIVFDVVETYHDDSGGKERGGNRIFLFSLDGLRICHLGDLGHLLGPEQQKELGAVDVLLIPVGGRFTIGPQEADRVIEQIQPKIVIPMHYKTDKCGFPIESVETFLHGKANVKRSPTSEVIIHQEDLPPQCTYLYIPNAN